MKHKSLISRAVPFLITIVLLGILAVSASADDITYYGYTQLTEKQKILYNAIHTAVTTEETPEYAAIPAADKVPVQDIDPAINAYLGDHPEAFYLNVKDAHHTYDGYVTKLIFTYFLNGTTATTAQIQTAKAKLQTKLEEIDAEMQNAGLETDREKALWLHDKVAEIVDYQWTDTHNHQTVYGALVEGESVCAGYAHSYQLLLQRNGISAWTVTGEATNSSGSKESHAWTLMWLDGKCLYTDVTWDDQGDDLYHLYYCRTLKDISTNHYPLNTFSLPECGDDCSGYLAFDENNTVTADITAAELAQKIKAQKGATVLFDPSGSILEKIANEDFMRELIFTLYPSVYRWGYSCNYVNSSTTEEQKCGAEVHLNITVPVTISGKATSFGDDPNEPVVIKLYRPNESAPAFTTQTTGSTYSIAAETGEYIMHVSKKNHVTRQYHVYIK